MGVGSAPTLVANGLMLGENHPLQRRPHKQQIILRGGPLDGDFITAPPKTKQQLQAQGATPSPGSTADAPSPLEVFCDQNPSNLKRKVYDAGTVPQQGTLSTSDAETKCSDDSETSRIVGVQQDEPR